MTGLLDPPDDDQPIDVTFASLPLAERCESLARHLGHYHRDIVGRTVLDLPLLIRTLEACARELKGRP